LWLSYKTLLPFKVIIIIIIITIIILVIIILVIIIVIIIIFNEGTHLTTAVFRGP